MKETAKRNLDGFLTLWISCNFPDLRQNHALLWGNTIMYKVDTHHLQHLTISSTAPVMIFSIPSLSLVPQVTVQILSSCANLKKSSYVLLLLLQCSELTTWPNRLASRHKLTLTSTFWQALRALHSLLVTCTHFGWDQTCKKIDAKFSLLAIQPKSMQV